MRSTAGERRVSKESSRVRDSTVALPHTHWPLSEHCTVCKGLLIWLFKGGCKMSSGTA